MGGRGRLYTVKPLKRGQFGDGPFVLCREVALSRMFLLKPMILHRKCVHKLLQC